jgi:hypothetical protein
MVQVAGELFSHLKEDIEQDVGSDNHAIWFVHIISQQYLDA